MFLQLAGSTQDLIFSQYYISPLHLNPAFTGLFDYPKLSVNYRQQWPSVNSAYESYGFTYDQGISGKNIGVGLILLSDSQGDGTLKTSKIGGTVSYKLKFNKDWQLKFGIESAFSQSRLDWEKLIFFDQLDPAFGTLDGFGNTNVSTEIRPDNLTQGYFDINMGMLIYNPTYYVGLSIDHLNSPTDSFLSNSLNEKPAAIPLVISIQAGYQIVMDRDNKGNPETFISPNVVFAAQSGFYQLNIGAYLKVKQFFTGMWVRHAFDNIDAIIFSAGVNINSLKLSYSFDLTTSELGLSPGGGHEVGIAVSLFNLEKKTSRYNDCLSLFH